MIPIDKVKASKAKCKRHRDNWKAKALKLERENAELINDRKILREVLKDLREMYMKYWYSVGAVHLLWKRAEALVAGKGGKRK